jgi:hypothetical protein
MCHRNNAKARSAIAASGSRLLDNILKMDWEKGNSDQAETERSKSDRVKGA